MKKTGIFAFAILLLLITVTACGDSEPSAAGNDTVQDPSGAAVQAEPIPGTEPPSGTEPIATAEPGTVPSSEPDADIYIEPPAFTQPQNLLKRSDTATVNGISYTVQDIQYTREFGSRNLENLNDLSRDGIDKNGNLLGNESYMFLTIEFTNTTDQAVEISRNQGGIRAISPELEVLQYGIEAVYCDPAWDKGTDSETFHWLLQPGESITSEICWLLSSREETMGEYGAGENWSLYFEAEANSSLDDPENLFIDLEMMAE